MPKKRPHFFQPVYPKGQKQRDDKLLEEKYATSYKKEVNKATQIVDCKYFTTNLIVVDGKVAINNESIDSFKIYLCVDGEVIIKYNDLKEVKLLKGETVLMPATFKEYQFLSSDKSELLEVYIK